MIVITHAAVKRLCKTGTVDVWTPRRSVRRCDSCGYVVRPARDENLEKGIPERPARCTGCKRFTEGDEMFVKPSLNVIHLVRTHSGRDSVARAQASLTRPAVLQELEYREALLAGFKTRDELWDHFRLKYATGPLVDSPVTCWVTTYAQVKDHPDYHMLAQPVAGHSGDYTSSAVRTIDKEAEALDPVYDAKLLTRWASDAEAQRKAARRLEWRGARKAA